MHLPRLHILVRDSTEGEEALECGAKLVQLRNKEFTDREFLIEAQRLRKRTKQAGALLVINDRCDVAALVQSDFLHLGPKDIPPKEAVSILGQGISLGISVDTPEEADVAQRLGAAYLGAGPFRASPSKDDTGPVLGVEGLKSIVDAVEIPVIGIGGIDRKNAEEALRSGCHGIAILSAFQKSENPQELIHAFCHLLGSKG